MKPKTCFSGDIAKTPTKQQNWNWLLGYSERSGLRVRKDASGLKATLWYFLVGTADQILWAKQLKPARLSALHAASASPLSKPEKRAR